jgi:DNA-binding transcriptional MerR regulator
MMTREATFTIQQVSEQTGLSTYTLRYYEDIGLLEPIQRAPNGHRRYTEADIRRIDFLMRLRKTHMPIEEMKYFVNLYRQGSETATERRDLLEAHRKVVQTQIDELCEILGFIDYKIALYIDEEQQNNERQWQHEHEISPVGENRSAGI